MPFTVPIKMVPSGLQVPPMTGAISAMVSGGPPLALIFLSCFESP
jgi:hypothetical protein